jgi:hypothetical protein
VYFHVKPEGIQVLSSGNIRETPQKFSTACVQNCAELCRTVQNCIPNYTQIGQQIGSDKAEVLLRP